jgi:chromosome partitioning protein
VKTLVFFNNKGGVGKTSLVYHLAWMFHELGVRVVAADLDPQSNLTAAFVPPDRLEDLWPEGDHPQTILGAITPLLDHLGDLRDPHVESVSAGLGILPGDLGLSLFEDRLAEAWSRCLDDNPGNRQDAFRVMTAFYRATRLAAEKTGADLALLDVGPSLGALNRAALVASDHVVVPLGADLFSLQGLRNLGPTLRNWRGGWEDRRRREPPPGLAIPSGEMRPVGYLVLQHAVRLDRPVKAYERWLVRIPSIYRKEVLGEGGTLEGPEVDPNRLGTLKHYRSLMPLAQDARKPMFFLKPADGALGGQAQAVQDCYRDFERLAQAIAGACAIPLPGGKLPSSGSSGS